MNDRDYERLWVASRQIDVRHFYMVSEPIESLLVFSAGYSTPEGVYHYGLVWYDCVSGEFCEERISTLAPNPA